MYYRYRAETYIPCTRHDSQRFPLTWHEAVNARIDFALHISFTLKFLFLVNMVTDKSLLLSAIPASENP